MYTNCDQLSNKFDKLLTVIYSDCLGIIVLVETIPKAQKTPIGLSSLAIPNYILFTNLIQSCLISVEREVIVFMWPTTCVLLKFTLI